MLFAPAPFLGGVPGQVVFLDSGSWTVPPGVTSICFVLVGAGGNGDDGKSGDGGGGGGSGGSLAYANTVSVTPGQTVSFSVGKGLPSYTIDRNARAPDGGNTSVTIGGWTLQADGGQGGAPYSTVPGATGKGYSQSGSPPAGVTIGGGAGGNGGSAYNGGGGGGGAGGYTGRGGHGSGAASHQEVTDAPLGNGGGGGGGGYYGLTNGNNGGGNGYAGYPDTAGGGGGGANIFSSTHPATNGAPSTGSDKTYPTKGGDGGFPGGGGGGAFEGSTGVHSRGGDGVVRIIWGPGRVFPTNAADV